MNNEDERNHEEEAWQERDAADTYEAERLAELAGEDGTRTPLEILATPGRPGFASVTGWEDGRTQAHIVYEGTDTPGVPSHPDTVWERYEVVTATEQDTLHEVDNVSGGRYVNLRMVEAHLEPRGTQHEGARLIGYAGNHQVAEPAQGVMWDETWGLLNADGTDIAEREF